MGITVITYGTFDLLHDGHIRLLERAKKLGTRLIVGITSDDFDRSRGKINVQQSLAERISEVKKTGLADQIVVEEYEGQKIDDIKRFKADIFTVGSDWAGHFDYLREYCKVVYLTRTQGISSTEIRGKQNFLKLGLVGYSTYLAKVIKEAKFVNGIQIAGVYNDVLEMVSSNIRDLEPVNNDYDSFLENVDAVYIHSHPERHYEEVKAALLHGKHVLCEAPIAMDSARAEELFELASSQKIVLMTALRTAFSTAYQRLLLLIKAGSIGEVKSVDATCTSLKNLDRYSSQQLSNTWGSMTSWGPTALLPVFQLFGTKYSETGIVSSFFDESQLIDTFSKVDLTFEHMVASIKVANGLKSEGELIISGTKGYAYVPSPWWKTDYFELRYENPNDNKRYFYQLDGEGIRNELVSFVRTIGHEPEEYQISSEVAIATSRIMELFQNKHYRTI